MANTRNIIAIPCVVYSTKSGKCEIDIPDLNIVVRGTTFVDTLADALMTTAAIATYRMDMNIPFEINHTYEGLVKDTAKIKTSHFIHLLTVNCEG